MNLMKMSNHYQIVKNDSGEFQLQFRKRWAEDLPFMPWGRWQDRGTFASLEEAESARLHDWEGHLQLFRVMN